MDEMKQVICQIDDEIKTAKNLSATKDEKINELTLELSTLEQKQKQIEESRELIAAKKRKLDELNEVVVQLEKQDEQLKELVKRAKLHTSVETTAGNTKTHNNRPNYRKVRHN